MGSGLTTFGMVNKCFGYILHATDPTITSQNWGGTTNLTNPGLYPLAISKYEDNQTETSFSFS
jgi:hypothetical protein